MKYVSVFISKFGINSSVCIKSINKTWWNNLSLLVSNCYEVVAMVATSGRYGWAILIPYTRRRVKPGQFLQTMKEMLWTAYWNINLPEMFQYSLKFWNSIDESWWGITRQVHTSWCENIHSSRLETIRLLEHKKWPQQLSVFLATSKYIIRSSTYMPKSMYIHLVYEVAFA